MLTQIVPPVVEPLSSADDVLRQQLRLEPGETEENALIDALCAAARGAAERHLRRVLITQTLRLSLPCWPARPVQFPVLPVQEIAAVRYSSAAGELRTLDPAEYRLALTGTLAALVPAPGRAWPATSHDPAAAVEIDFVAGFGASAAAIPADILQAIRMHAAQLFAYREAVGPAQLAEVPLGARDMLAGWRVWA